MAYYLEIHDISGPRYFAPDVVPQVVMDQFKAQIETLQTYYQKRILNPNYTYTKDDYDAIAQARATLLQYADQGIPINLPGLQTGYLNQTMAKTLDTLLKTFDIAGIGDASNTTDAAKAAAMQRWYDLSIAGLGEYIGDALNAVSSGRSIQAMIQLEYIKAGNDLITNKLSGLQSALSLTQKATQMLTSLQNIHNKVEPIPQPAVAPTGTGDDYVDDYKRDGDGAYLRPIPVRASASLSTADIALFNSYKTEDGALYKLIEEVLPQLGNYTVADLGPPPIAALDGTLPQALFTVYNDMKSAGTAQKWISDHLGTTTDYDSTLGGNYSRNLTVSQTAAQSLNDQQKQNVQQALFLFQEFYQSGSGMLTQLNQIIQSMARAMAS